MHQKPRPNVYVARTVKAFLGLSLFLAAGLLTRDAHAQGCVAIRNNPGTAMMQGNFTNLLGSHDDKWLGTIAYRWFRSDKHFVGDVEHPERQVIGNQVINDVHGIDANVSYAFTPRLSATLGVPFIVADRSSLYEHDLTNRHSMNSQGLGDIRVTADYWLLDPHKHMNGNVALGLGFKAPTGDSKATDLSYRSTGAVYRPVDLHSTR